MQERRATRNIGVAALASPWRWIALVVLLGGGALAQQQLQRDAKPSTAVLIAVAAGLVALLIVDVGTLFRTRADDRRADAMLADSNDVVLHFQDRLVAGVRGPIERTLGMTPDAAIGLLPHEVLPTPEPERLQDAFVHALGQRDTGARVTALPVIDQLSGERRYVDLTVRERMHDRSVRGQVVTVSDATDRVLAQQAVAIAASIDPETRLPNRERLLELLDMTLHRARRKGDHVALLSVGLDRHATLVEGFDEKGREAIMTEVARRIRSTIRLEDPVGRTAPDQFGVVLGGLEPRIGRAFALDVADRITRIVADPFEVAGSQLTLAVSVGAAHRAQGQPEPAPSELLADAEESLAMVRANTNRWKDTSPA